MRWLSQALDLWLLLFSESPSKSSAIRYPALLPLLDCLILWPTANRLLNVLELKSSLMITLRLLTHLFELFFRPILPLKSSVIYLPDTFRFLPLLPFSEIYIHRNFSSSRSLPDLSAIRADIRPQIYRPKFTLQIFRILFSINS